MSKDSIRNWCDTVNEKVWSIYAFKEWGWIPSLLRESLMMLKEWVEPKRAMLNLGSTLNIGFFISSWCGWHPRERITMQQMDVSRFRGHNTYTLGFINIDLIVGQSGQHTSFMWWTPKWPTTYCSNGLGYITIRLFHPPIINFWRLCRRARESTLMQPSPRFNEMMFIFPRLPISMNWMRMAN